MKIKILFQLNQLGYGGTEKAIYTICKHLNKDTFEPYLFFYTDYQTIRYYGRWILSNFSKKHAEGFKQKYQTYFARLSDFQTLLGKDKVFLGQGKDFLRCLDTIVPQIIHFNRGNSDDFYTSLIHQIPAEIKLFETNIFGRSANDNYLKRLSKIGFVSQWLYEKSSWKGDKGVVIYNPIVSPMHQQNIRSELNIPNEAIVLGRISRPDLDDGDFILEVFKKLKNDLTYLLVIGASDNFRKEVASIKNIILIEPTRDESRLSSFYNTLDILLHYRKEGETFGMNIAEAMIHGKPVVTHKSDVDNAQVELLDPTDYGAVGFVVSQNDVAAYTEAVQKLMSDPGARVEMGKNAQNKARSLYLDSVVTKHLEHLYSEILEK